MQPHARWRKGSGLEAGAIPSAKAAGEEIMRVRREKEMSQLDLAELTKIVQADISRLENGCGNPTLRTLERFAAALGCTLIVRLEPAGGENTEI